MSPLNRFAPTLCFLGLAVTLVGSTGCATRERVVVRDRPEVVRVVAPPPPVVVQERVIVRP